MNRLAALEGWKRAAALVTWFLPFGFIVEGWGVAFEDESLSVTAALGSSALLGAVFVLMEWVEENLTQALTRFLAIALGFGLLLVVIAPMARGDGVEPIPNVFFAVGVAAMVAALDRLLPCAKRWAEGHRRHPAS